LFTVALIFELLVNNCRFSVVLIIYGSQKLPEKSMKVLAISGILATVPDQLN
jgi:hypothetical protein